MPVVIEGRRKGGLRCGNTGVADDAANAAAFSDAAVADLADEMRVPEELLRMVLER